LTIFYKTEKILCTDLSYLTFLDLLKITSHKVARVDQIETALGKEMREKASKKKVIIIYTVFPCLVLNLRIYFINSIEYIIGGKSNKTSVNFYSYCWNYCGQWIVNKRNVNLLHVN